MCCDAQLAGRILGVGNVRGDCQGKCLGELSGGETFVNCPDPHAGLSVSTSGGYFYPGEKIFITLVNTHTQTAFDRLYC